MTGGFSYPLSQLNRVTQAQRQPGSAIKPLSYLAALAAACSPIPRCSDEPITLPPIGGGTRAREQDYWTPRNYDGGGGGTLTLRRALENSRNLATVHLLDGGIDDDAGSKPRPAVRAGAGGADLQGVRASTIRSCWAPSRCGRSISRPSTRRSPTRASVRCRTPSIRSSATACSSTATIPSRRPPSAPPIGVSFYQLKTMMQGVLSRGTARTIAGARALCGRQDRHLRRRQRRLVRRLHQRRHGGGLGRLRQRQRQAAHARRRRHRRQHRGADLRADHPGGVGQSFAEGGARAAVARGQAADDLLGGCGRRRSLRSNAADQKRPGRHGMSPTRPHRAGRSTPSTSWSLAKRATAIAATTRRRRTRSAGSSRCSSSSTTSAGNTTMNSYGRPVPREAVRPPAQTTARYRRDPRAQQQPQRVEPNFWGFRRF